jgi:hypothetical protein
MYAFNKLMQGDKSWCFELDSIHLVLEGFFIKEDKHWIKNPVNAIAFFNVDGNLYGISNQTHTYLTAESLYDVMLSQYVYFNEELFSERFFREYGFVLHGNAWQLELKDQLGLQHHLEYRPDTGWYYDRMLLKRQPDNVGDLMHLCVQKTGSLLQRVS